MAAAVMAAAVAAGGGAGQADEAARVDFLRAFRAPLAAYACLVADERYALDRPFYYRQTAGLFLQLFAAMTKVPVPSPHYRSCFASVVLSLPTMTRFLPLHSRAVLFNHDVS